MVLFIRLPNFFVFLESAPLFHWHLTKNMHSSPIFHFFTHTHFSLVITLSAVNAGFKVADMTFHWDFSASTHNLFVNTSSITNSPLFFVEVHGYKCFLISHFTQTTVILWWEKLQLGITSRFQSLITCFEQIVFKFLLIRVWTSKRLKRLRAYYASLTR